jgi:hypothetical protein
MRGEDLRKEIFGNEGFANWLRREKLSPKALAQKAQQRTQAKLGALNCEKVNDFLCSLVDDEYEIYLEVERELIETAIESFLKAGEEERRKYPNLNRLILQVQTQIVRSSDPIETLIEISKPLAHFYKLLMESFAQSRKTRAGGSAQYHIEFILDELGYKGLYERQRVLNGTVDFLFPSFEMWQKDRRRCTVLSVKRTLRERYKQVFEELSATRGLVLYLLSTQTESEAQKDITQEKVQRLNEQNVYLIVRDEIKQGRFSQEANVLGFTDFFCKELPRLKERWK